MTPEAFRHIYEQHHLKMLAFARRLAGDDCAEDLVQNAFVVLWEAGEHPNPESFLYTVIHNQSVNLAIADQRHRRHHLELHRLTPSQAEQIEAAITYAELLAKVMAAVSPQQQRIVTMYRDGYSTREIARIEGVTTDTVRVQKARVRKLYNHIKSKNHD